MDYLLLKWLHIMSSTILFGAGVGSAFHLFACSLRRRVDGLATTTRNVVLADWLLTTPAAVLQPVTGVWLVQQMGLPYSTPWIAWSLGLYALAIACWLPVVALQIRMEKVAAAAQRRRAGAGGVRPHVPLVDGAGLRRLLPVPPDLLADGEQGPALGRVKEA
nr:DUF2269 domain-containing protein [Ramlibacter montanisoli]